MNDVLIEKNVVIPPARVKRNYPYREMEIGDSFFVEDDKLSGVCNTNNRMQRLLGWRFTARTEGKGVRVWRTE
jgi:hypothetical protein